MGVRRACIAALLTGSVSLAALPAHADLQLCNRTSYILDLALGLETKGSAATRGWFRVDPGQCRPVLQGTIEADRLYVHARPHRVYHEPPMPQARHADLCIAENNFVIAGAHKCPTAGQRLAAFTEVKPSEAADGHAAYLSEDAEYTIEQARLAGVQRLLVAAGYDAEPIDGIEGKKTEAALAQFLKDRNLAAADAGAPGFFDTLVKAAQETTSTGITWCNDTRHTVMAALGVEERDGIVTRGWYRLTAGRCLKPELGGKPARVFSFAEAVDDEGRTIRRAHKPLAWGGPVVLCTRELTFEIAQHKDCAGRGLNPTGFADVALGDRKGATVRFRE